MLSLREHIVHKLSPQRDHRIDGRSIQQVKWVQVRRRRRSDMVTTVHKVLAIHLQSGPAKLSAST